jgi:hypothetical protein
MQKIHRKTCQVLIEFNRNGNWKNSALSLLFFIQNAIKKTVIVKYITSNIQNEPFQVDRRMFGVVKDGNEEICQVI